MDAIGCNARQTRRQFGVDDDSVSNRLIAKQHDNFANQLVDIDPFALRRAALGVLRICVEGRLPLDVAALLKSALDAQPAGKKDGATLGELVEFVFERLRAYYSDQSLPVEMFEAVKALEITSPLPGFARSYPRGWRAVLRSDPASRSAPSP